MIENVMVLDGYWDDEPDEDYYDEYGTEGNVIDCLFDKELVHMFMESYLDVEDLEEKEYKCESIFSAMMKENPVSFQEDFRDWMLKNEDSLRDIFNDWYVNR